MICITFMVLQIDSQERNSMEWEQMTYTEMHECVFPQRAFEWKCSWL